MKRLIVYIEAKWEWNKEMMNAKLFIDFRFVWLSCSCIIIIIIKKRLALQGCERAINTRQSEDPHNSNP